MSEVSVTNVPVPMVPVEVFVREPFDALYHREFAGLVRLAMVLVDSQEQAEEVVQDAFGALYLEYRLVSTPLPYVRASVLNGSRKVLRRSALLPREGDVLQSVFSSSAQPPQTTIYITAPDTTTTNVMVEDPLIDPTTTAVDDQIATTTTPG